MSWPQRILLAAVVVALVSGLVTLAGGRQVVRSQSEARILLLDPDDPKIAQEAMVQAAGEGWRLVAVHLGGNPVEGGLPASGRRRDTALWAFLARP